MTKLEEKIRAKSFVVTTELTPPKGTDLTDLFAKADALKGYADAINLTESPRARMAVEPKAVARLLIERGHEPIVQVTARDRRNVFEQLIEAVKYNSLGQISHALYEVGGEYRRNM